ncbi:oligogalacturonate-specific porin KdgM family protein [Endozoicomonas arenosclerae]|uniref:oligogalacturonate-specific porin KdgM family protein n=1 Tax=Endozoicomonas arenosclerae TaxID=1633495 RepID=UPI000782903D|nr:oligogalacturonate-specific porin KdgM family protein [Endozoicomonas arenosclerae]
MNVKALAFAMAAGAVLPAFSKVTGVADLNVKGDDYALEAGAKFNGLSITGEYVVDTAKNSAKEFTGTAKYRYDIGEQFYLEPVISYTRSFKDKVYADGPSGYQYRPIDTTKMGLKGGWNSDFGLYAAARYRYEMGGLESKDLASIGGEKGKEETRKVHRTDLTFGYQFEKVTAQYNWVHKKAKQDEFLFANGKKSSNTHEVKFAYTDLGSFTPYVEFSFEEKGKTNTVTKKKESKDSVKVGMQFTY